MWSAQAINIDPDSLRYAAGATSYARGVEYFRSGRVAQIWWEEARGRLTLHGKVLGRAGDYYQTVLYFTGYSEQTLELDRGECSCPMAVDCKHVVAVALAAAGPERAIAQPGSAQPGSAQPGSAQPGSAQPGHALLPTWEQSLDSLLRAESAMAGDRGDTPLAIELGLVRVPPSWSFAATRTVTGSGAPAETKLRLQARLVQPGKNGWVGGNLSWGRLDTLNQQGGYRGEQIRLLRELYTSYRSGAVTFYLYGSDKSIDLTSFGSRQLWPMLDEAAAIGVQLVYPHKLGTVARYASAEFSLDVTAGGSPDALLVSSSLRIDLGGSSPRVGTTPGDLAPIAFIGADGHGVIYADRAETERTSEPGGWRFGLAKLVKPVPKPLQELTLADRRLEVPAVAHTRFRDEYYLRLRHMAEVVSSDGAFIPPLISGPVMVVHADYGDAHDVTVTWEWSYQVGDSWLTAAPHSLSTGEEHRDPAAERAILAALEAPLARFGLYRAACARLTGLNTMRFSTELLPMLASHPEVNVEITGDPADYREVGDSLRIGMSVSETTGDTDWFDLGITISAEGREVPFIDVFLALSRGESYLLLAGGGYFSLEKPELQELARLITEARSLQDSTRDPWGPLKISRYQAGLWEELAELGVVSHQAAAWQRQIEGLTSVGSIQPEPPPAGLNALLRPYQVDGYSWLRFLWQHQLGGILADDMGLGKTVQSLALLSHARQEHPDSPPFLIVAPTSVVPNWAAETARFAPGLAIVVLTETTARRGTPLAQAIAGADAVVTSYALLRIDFQHYASLAWSGLILDEAQHAKNHQSKIYQCARRLPAPFKLAITGTPMENNLMELWSLLSITAPGLFPQPVRFRDYYARPIESRGPDHAELLTQLRRRIKPLVKRRTKEQVAADLPPKHEQVLEVELHPRHRKIYQTHLQRERQKVLGLIDDLNAHRFTILRSLTVLRQLSLHAGLVDDEYHDIPSAKVDVLLEHLRAVDDGGHRALVFSQFTGFLRKVRQRLDNEGVRYCYLDGSTRDRARVLGEFKEGSAPVFLISLKAGGFGLNLTEADYCFLLDPWWNPATESQAVDRTHRIGQTRNVMVYRLIAKDTIEEKVMALKAGKAELFASVLDDGNLFGASLSADDIRGLFA